MSRNVSDHARELLLCKRYYCAESVLLAIAEDQGVRSDLIPRIATGFCSGMARSGGMCGAVSGGIMSIGLILGRKSANDQVDPCYQAVRAFMDQFMRQFSTLSCLELTGVHLGTAEGQIAFKEKGQLQLCANYVAEAARLVTQVMGTNQA